jgi:RHS repeat-associated protein
MTHVHFHTFDGNQPMELDWEDKTRNNVRIGLVREGGLFDANGNNNFARYGNINYHYNFLNLLSEVSDAATRVAQVRYRYRADGGKLQVRDGSGTSGYDYLGRLTLAKTPGTITPEATFAEGVIHAGEVLFFEKDHLGSVRAVVNRNDRVLERNDYWPFGMRHENSRLPVSAAGRFKFNGKESQVSFSASRLDYGARMYQTDHPRWYSIDPLAEKYPWLSPYAFANNNPIRYVDWDGRDWNIEMEEDENEVRTYHMTVNAALINNSGSNIDMNAMEGAIRQQIMDTYNVSGEGYSVDMTLNLRTVTSARDIGARDHVFQIVDQSTLSSDVLASADLRGLNIRIGSETALDVISGANVRTVPHELGHTGGLRDNPRDGGGLNLMMQTSKIYSDPSQATSLYQGQFGRMNEAYQNGSLNYNSPVYSTFGVWMNQGILYWGNRNKLRIR